jgi:hypothetical protein
VASLGAIAACGGSGNSHMGAPPSTTSAEKLSSLSPSTSAKMICETEVRGEIADSLGVRETRVVPSWSKQQHLFSCTYEYPRGKIVLSVKELANESETTAYLYAIRKKYGTKKALGDLSQGARGWVLKNDDVVSRKDYKVLLVDVQGIPANFANGLSRSTVASTTAITTAIMLCWTGA